MPESAEVKITVNQLSAEFAGQDLVNMEIVGGRFVKEGIDGLDRLTFPLKNMTFHCKGKFIYWVAGEEVFFISLAMSGSFGKRNKHSGVRFVFSNGEIFFNDIRHFGTVKVGMSQIDLWKKLNSLGWDPFTENNVPTDIIFRFRKNSNKKICDFLMEQKEIAGIGNYLRAEILYRSHINPFRLISDLSDEEIINICENYILIANLALENGGTTLSTYVDIFGMKGKFSNHLKVYGKKVDENGFCVLKAKDKNGRTIHYVPKLQQ